MLTKLYYHISCLILEQFTISTIYFCFLAMTSTTITNMHLRACQYSCLCHLFILHYKNILLYFYSQINYFPVAILIIYSSVEMIPQYIITSCLSSFLLLVDLVLTLGIVENNFIFLFSLILLIIYGIVDVRQLTTFRILIPYTSYTKCIFF